jgi:hypothetical protein
VKRSRDKGVAGRSFQGTSLKQAGTIWGGIRDEGAVTGAALGNQFPFGGSPGCVRGEKRVSGVLKQAAG